MSTNGIPQLTAEDKGNGRTIVTVGTMPSSGTPAASQPGRPARPSVVHARTLSPQPPAGDPAKDSHTLTLPVVGSASQPPAGPTPVVNPPAAPTPTTPTADAKEHTMPKRRFMPTRAEAMLPLGFVVLLAFLLAALHGRVLGGSWVLTILVTLCATIPAIFTVPAANRFVRSVKDKVPGNETEPLMRLLIIIVCVLSVIVVLLGAAFLSDRMQINWGGVLYVLFVYAMTTGFACAASYRSEAETSKEQ